MTTIISELDIIQYESLSDTIVATGLSASGTGSLSGTIGSLMTVSADPGGDPDPTAISIDPLNDTYFLGFFSSSSATYLDDTTGIYRETFGTTASFTSANSIVSTDEYAGGGTIAGEVQGIDTDVPDNILYFTAGDYLEEASFSSAGFTGAPSVKTLSTIHQLNTSSGQALEVAGAGVDTEDHLAYVAAQTASVFISFTSGGFGNLTTIATYTGNYIYKITGLTRNASSGTTANTIAIPFADGIVENIVYDSINGNAYFVTDPDVNTTKVSGIFEVSGTTVSKIWAETITSNSELFFTNLTVDDATGDYYLVDNNGVYEGNVDSGAAPTLEVSVANNAARALGIDDGPAYSSASVLAIDGNTSRTTGDAYTGDTVTLAVTFSAPVTASGGASLSLNDGGSAAYASGSGTDVLDFTYTVASGQNISTLQDTGDSGTFKDADGAALNGSITATFSGLGVDSTPPSLSLTGTSTEALEGGGAINPISNAVIDDPDGTGTLTGARVTLVGSTSGDNLGISGATAGTTDGGAISYAEAGGVLTLSGSAAIADYEAALESVTYQDGASQNTPHPKRTIAVSVQESSLSSTLANTTITIDHAPVGAAGGFSGTIAEGGVLSGSSPGLLAGDSDGDSDQLTITGYAGAGGSTLAGDRLDGSYGGIFLVSDGAYSYTAGNTGAIDAAAAGSTPVDDFNITISDGNGGLTTESVAFDIVRPPTINAGGTVTAFQTYAMAIDPTATVADPDGADITAATISIASGFEAGDMLSLASGNGITVTYNAGTGELDLSGAASAAAYQAAIDDIVFSAASYDPADTTRVIDYSVSALDSGITAASSTGTSVITISSMPCFCAGTRLLSTRGDVAVEDIAVGDTLVTVREGGPLTGRVIWTGRRALEIARHADPASVRPVRIRAGAIAPGVPERDLRVSPRHALYLNGALFEAIALVNGISIYQEQAVAHVTYHHIELAAHDIVLAEGLPCESYLDTGSRHEFEGEAALVLHPGFAASRGALCAPLIQDGGRIARERRRLAARLEALAGSARM